jgi:hypothetical protein
VNESARAFPGFEYPSRDGRRLLINRFKAEAESQRIWVRIDPKPGTRHRRAAIPLDPDQARAAAAAIHELLGARG